MRKLSKFYLQNRLIRNVAKKREKKILKWRNYLTCFFVFTKFRMFFASFRKIHIREKCEISGITLAAKYERKFLRTFCSLETLVTAHGDLPFPLNKGYRYRKLFNACLTKRTSKKIMFSYN